MRSVQWSLFLSPRPKPAHRPMRLGALPASSSRSAAPTRLCFLRMCARPGPPSRHSGCSPARKGLRAAERSGGEGGSDGSAASIVAVGQTSAAGMHPNRKDSSRIRRNESSGATSRTFTMISWTRSQRQKGVAVPASRCPSSRAHEAGEWSARFLISSRTWPCCWRPAGDLSARSTDSSIESSRPIAHPAKALASSEVS
jgi:hypothetical protein